MADQNNLRHSFGCNQADCWRDEGGTEYHRGNHYGVYVLVEGALGPLFVSASGRKIVQRGPGSNSQEIPVESTAETAETANHPQPTKPTRCRRIIILDEEETT